MRVAVNLRLYVKGKIGGLENYIRHVVPAVCEAQRQLGHQPVVFAHEDQLANVSALAPGARIVPVTHESADTIVRAELASGSYDLLFCPLLVLDPMPVGIPSAVMMPDLQHEFFPEFFAPNTLKWRRQTYRPSTVHASCLFTLSEHARQTLVDAFRVDPAKVQVIYLDVDEEFKTFQPRPASPEFQALRLPERYIFYPANFWPHKNHGNLLKAFKQVLASKPGLGLVLTGASEDKGRIQAEIDALGLRNNVFLPGYVSRSLLVEIYHHALALVFVSLFEGFGIPILEAFHTGTPVLTSNAGSCEEIAGSGALTVDPLDPVSIANGVHRLIDDSELRTSLIAAGHKRKRDFSWTRATDLTLATFNRITDPTAQVRHRIEVREYPLVSIVTPSSNMGRFIRQTVESVLSQDYPHIDYIVMDAGSKDDTVPILESYNGRLRFESKPDGGQADAVNQGFAMSRGRVFTFLNADDTYMPGAVSSAVKHMMNNPSMGVVYGEANYVQEDGTVIGRYPTLPFDAQTLNSRCFICQPASFMWSDVFQTAGCMNPQLHFALDYDLWMRIAKLYPMLKVDEVLATSRMYLENKTLGKRRPVYMEIMSAAKTHYGYIPFDWVFGYASYAIDRKDQFFEVSHPSFSKIALSLVLGSYYNKGQMLRYWREWGMHLGIGSHFNGRYGDSWISRRYETQLNLSQQCKGIRVEGRHLAPFKKGLDITFQFADQLLDRLHLQEHGPFSIFIECPAALRGRTGMMVVEASRTFRPGANGDYRKLSCIIDSMTPEDGD
jgi:glycosyltransferase involved in cell wall biosynthesis